MKNPSKEQVKAWNRNYYLKNKDKRKDQYNKTRNEVIQWFRDYKASLKCKECGFNHPAALSFHHRNGEEKLGEVSVIAWEASKKKLLEEIKKCDVLCHNCHAIHHYNERENGKD